MPCFKASNKASNPYHPQHQIPSLSPRCHFFPDKALTISIFVLAIVATLLDSNFFPVNFIASESLGRAVQVALCVCVCMCTACVLAKLFNCVGVMTLIVTTWKRSWKPHHAVGISLPCWSGMNCRHDMMPLRPVRILYNSRPRLDNRLDQHPCRRHSSSSSRCPSYRDVLLFGPEHFQHHVPEAGYAHQKGRILPFFVCMHGPFQYAWSHLGLALCDWFPPTFTPVCSCYDCGRQESQARWRGRKSSCSLCWLWASRQLLHIGLLTAKTC